MRAWRIQNMVIAADIAEEAREFYREEIGGPLPDVSGEADYGAAVACADGTIRTVRERIHEEMDARNDWLRMGVPCELHWPFVVGTVPSQDSPLDDIAPSDLQ